MYLSRPLFLFLLCLPVLEIYLLIRVGSWLGAIPTIALVVFSAVLGVLLLRHHGWLMARQVQAALQRGEEPSAAMLEGMLVLLAGLLLLVPGFFTDVLGLLFLLPVLRNRLVGWLLRKGLPHTGRRAHADSTIRRGPATLEGQFTREDE